MGYGAENLAATDLKGGCAGWQALGLVAGARSCPTPGLTCAARSSRSSRAAITSHTHRHPLARSTAADVRQEAEGGGQLADLSGRSGGTTAGASAGSAHAEGALHRLSAGVKEAAHTAKVEAKVGGGAG